MHSALRWVALVLLVVTLVKAWQNRGGAFTKGQGKLGLFTMITLHVQLLLGLATIQSGTSTGMINGINIPDTK